MLENNVFKNIWNVIKYVEFFFMLCIFSKVNNVLEKIIMFNFDFMWKVLILNKNVIEFMENVLEKLINMGNFFYLFDFVDRSFICLGIDD